MDPAAQCITVIKCAPLLLQGPTVSAPLLAQSTSVGEPMLVPGTVLPPVTRVPSMADVPMLFPGVGGTGAYAEHRHEYRKKRRSRVQNRSAGCVLSCTNPSRQQEEPTFCLQNKAYQFEVLPFSLSTAPQVFTRLGHTVAAYLQRQGILVIPISTTGLYTTQTVKFYYATSLSFLRL